MYTNACMFVSLGVEKRLDGSEIGVGRRSCRLAKTIQTCAETFGGAVQLSSAQLRESEREGMDACSRGTGNGCLFVGRCAVSLRCVALCCVWCCATLVIRAALVVGSSSRSSRNANEEEGNKVVTLTPFNAPIADVEFRASLIRGLAAIDASGVWLVETPKPADAATGE